MTLKTICKRVIALLLMAMLLLSMAGCRIVLAVVEDEKVVLKEKSDTESGGLGTGLGSAGANAVEEQKLSGTLKMQVFTNESGMHSEAWTNVVTAFEEATGISVTLIMGSQVNTQYSAAWLAGEAPADIVWIAGNGIADEEMEDSGMFYDLTEFLESATIYGTDAKIQDKLNMDVVEKNKGAIYKTPLMNSVQGMWYDKRIVETVPKNFEEFKTVATELSNKGIAGMTYPGMYADYNIWALIMPAVAAYGEEFFMDVAKGTPEAFQDERFKAVMNRYKEYCDAGYLLKGSTSADHTTSQLNWLNGKAGFITNGLWLEAEMQDYIPAGFEMAFSASPLIEKEQTPTLVVHANNLAVSSQTKNLENALEFLRFVYRDDVQMEYMSKYSYLSALTGLNYEDAELTDVARETLDYYNSAEVNKVDCNVSWSSLLNNTFKQVINDVSAGTMTIDEACGLLTADAKR